MRTDLSQRTRFAELICYDPPEGGCFNEILKQCKHWAYIFHDKDENKVPHYHFLVYFPNAKTLSAILTLHTSEQTVRVYAQRDRKQRFQYLTHKGNPDKYQYPDTDIVCDDLSYWSSVADDTVATTGYKAASMIEDLLNGLPLMDFFTRYGVHAMLNIDRILDAARKVKLQRMGCFPDYSYKPCSVDPLALQEVDPDDVPF